MCRGRKKKKGFFEIKSSGGLLVRVAFPFLHQTLPLFYKSFIARRDVVDGQLSQSFGYLLCYGTSRLAAHVKWFRYVVRGWSMRVVCVDGRDIRATPRMRSALPLERVLWIQVQVA